MLLMPIRVLIKINPFTSLYLMRARLLRVQAVRSSMTVHRGFEHIFVESLRSY